VARVDHHPERWLTVTTDMHPASQLSEMSNIRYRLTFQNTKFEKPKVEEHPKT
jgi:hypothetical protein